MDPIEQKIREFISKEFLNGKDMEFDRNASLLETGMIDSIGLFRLIAFMEEALQIRIPDQDLMAENFRTLDHIVQYVKTRKGA